MAANFVPVKGRESLSLGDWVTKTFCRQKISLHTSQLHLWQLFCQSSIFVGDSMSCMSADCFDKFLFCFTICKVFLSQKFTTHQTSWWGRPWPGATSPHSPQRRWQPLDGGPCGGVCREHQRGLRGRLAAGPPGGGCW